MTLSATRGILGGIAILFAVSSCGSSPSPTPMPLTEHRAVASSQATKLLGEDCTVNGSTICRSGACGHFAPLPEKGHFCTRRCNTSEDCPQDWNCNQFYPTPQGRICVPPSTWDGRVALLRQGQIQ